jgi:hypothetical protein
VGAEVVAESYFGVGLNADKCDVLACPLVQLALLVFVLRQEGD